MNLTLSKSLCTDKAIEAFMNHLILTSYYK